MLVDSYTHDIIFSIFNRTELNNENIECKFQIPIYLFIFFFFF